VKPEWAWTLAGIIAAGYLAHVAALALLR